MVSSSIKGKRPKQELVIANSSSSHGQSYFSAEDDLAIERSDVGSDECGIGRLTWRGEPSDTLADWSIVVVTNQLHSCAYHVHRSTMCFGPRSSRVFAKTMAKSSDKMNLSGMPTTKVELDERDAVNFPIMLDFMYDASAKGAGSSGTVLTANSTMTTNPSSGLLQSFSSSSEDSPADTGFAADAIHIENAVSVRYLARIFEIESLMTAVNKFIQTSLSIETGPTFLLHAHEYNDERLEESARRLCVDNFIQLDHRVMTKLPIPLFRAVVKSFESFEKSDQDEDDKPFSLVLSEVICRFLERQREHVDATLLLEMTDSLLIPYLASEAAIGLTSLVKALEAEDAQNHWEGLVRLCRRCAQTVVQEYGWNDFSVDRAIEEYLGNSVSIRSEANCVDSLLFATSFAAALTQAQADYNDVASQQSLVDGVLGSLHKTVDMLEKTNERKDRFVEQQAATIHETRMQVEQLKDELTKTRQKLKNQKAMEAEIRELRQQLEMQKRLATAIGEAYSQDTSTSESPTHQQRHVQPKTPKARNGRTPPRHGTPPRHHTPPRSSRRSPVRKPEIELSEELSQDPAIRDLVSPSLALSSSGRGARVLDAQTLQKLRSTPLA